MFKRPIVKAVFFFGLTIVFVKVVPLHLLDLTIYSVISLFLILSFIKSMAEYQISKKGPYTMGKIVKIDRLKLEQQDDFNSKNIVEFLLPFDNKVHSINYKSLFLSRSRKKENVKVWINTRDPDKSIVIDQFDNYWILIQFQKILFILIFWGLTIWKLAK